MLERVFKERFFEGVIELSFKGGGRDYVKIWRMKVLDSRDNICKDLGIGTSFSS